MNHQQIAELAKHTCIFICNDDMKNLFVGELEDVLYKDNADFIPVLAKVITTKRSTAEFQEVPEGVDPRLYPAGADFDLDFFTKTINNKKSLTVFRFTLSNYLKINILHTVLDGLTPAISNAESFLKYLDRLWLAVPDEITNNDELTNFVIKELDKRNLLDDMTLLPAILRAIYEGLDEIPEGFLIDHKHDAECNEIIQAAKKDAPQIPHITARRAEKIQYPTTKIDNNIWSEIATTDPEGQFKWVFDTPARNGKAGKGALITVSLKFDALQDISIVKKLTQFDKRVYVAAASLFAEGKRTFSIATLFKSMGNKGDPNTEQRNKIIESLTKMGAARISVDNRLEVNAYNGKYEVIKVTNDQLLHFKIETYFINGQLTEQSIHLLEEPVLATIARQRKQITKFPAKILEHYKVSKTEINLAIEDYIIQRINWMKNDKKAPHKIAYNTVNEECHITARNTKNSTPKKVKNILDDYKEQSWIKAYKEEPDGVTIIL